MLGGGKNKYIQEQEEAEPKSEDQRGDRKKGFVFKFYPDKALTILFLVFGSGGAVGLEGYENCMPQGINGSYGPSSFSCKDFMRPHLCVPPDVAYLKVRTLKQTSEDIS